MSLVKISNPLFLLVMPYSISFPFELCIVVFPWLKHYLPLPKIEEAKRSFASSLYQQHFQFYSHSKFALILGSREAVSLSWTDNEEAASARSPWALVSSTFPRSTGSSTTFMFQLPFSSRSFFSCLFSMSSHSSLVSSPPAICNYSSEGVPYHPSTFFNLYFMQPGGIITNASAFVMPIRIF